ncbi:HlyD family secretion protein [Hellea sp.]|nr:HlyD family secretion protein [Hellea sp.]
MEPFFRKEVSDKYSGENLGTITLTSPISYKIWFFALLLFFITLIFFLIKTDYARREKVAGTIIPSQGVVRVVAPNEGVIEKIYVSPSDTVLKGQALVKFSNNNYLEDGRNREETLTSEINNEILNKEKKIITLQEAKPIIIDNLNEQKASKIDEIKFIDNRIKDTSRVIEIENGIFLRYQKLLDSETTSILEVSRQELSLLNRRQELNSLQSQKIILRSEISQIESEIELNPITSANEIADLQNEITRLKQELIDLSSNSASIITSPINGKVAYLIGNTGQPVAGQTILALLPEEARFEVELYIPSSAIGYIQEGDEIRVEIDGYPYQKFGYQIGRVSRISEAVIKSNYLEEATGLNDPVFVARLTLKNQKINFAGKFYPIQSGMTVKGNLVIEKRKLWKWLFGSFMTPASEG